LTYLLYLNRSTAAEVIITMKVDHFLRHRIDLVAMPTSADGTYLVRLCAVAIVN